MANTFNLLAENAPIIAALRTCVDLPEHLTSITITLEMDKLPVVTCAFHPVTKGGCLELTTLDDTVRRYAYVG